MSLQWINNVKLLSFNPFWINNSTIAYLIRINKWHKYKIILKFLTSVKLIYSYNFNEKIL